jgi:hypothetical protein
MKLQEREHILKIIYPFQDQQKIKVFFSVGNYEEKAVLNGLDYSRTTFRNNNEYKISKKLTLNQNFSFGITKSNKAFKCFYECLQAITYYPVRFQMDNMACHLLETMVCRTTGSSFNNVGNPVAQLDFLMKNKKCHLTRWFEIRL